MTSFRFNHGAGDVCHMAHILKMYTNRGHKIQVQCDPDKAPLFLAAGCEIVERARAVHHYDHAPQAGKPRFNDPWSGSKIAWNITNGPLPHIGGYDELWSELCSIRLQIECPEPQRQEIDSFLASMPQPVIGLHLKGNSCPENKNLSDDEARKLYVALLEKTDGSLLLFDWDNRLPRNHNARVRHLQDDFRTLNIPELIYTLSRIALLVGIDSGVTHCIRLTDTPCIGLWPVHYPSHFSLPREATLNLVEGPRNPSAGLTTYRRHAFNIINTDLSPNTLARFAADMLAGKTPKRIVHDCLLEACRVEDKQNKFVDRHISFRRFFDALRAYPDPVIIGTGCTRQLEDYGAGYSDYLIGWFLTYLHPGTLHTVDLSEKSLAVSKECTQPFPCVKHHHSHSHKFLAEFQGEVTAAYFDSQDTNESGYQACCLEEVKLVQRLNPKLILIDDTWKERGNWRGKGESAVPWLLENGWKLDYAGYQALLVKA